MIEIKKIPKNPNKSKLFCSNDNLPWLDGIKPMDDIACRKDGRYKNHINAIIEWTMK